MSEQDTAKAWPLQKYFGGENEYEAYETDREGWAIQNDDDEFLASRDPKTIPRVEAPYTVAADKFDEFLHSRQICDAR